MSNIYTFTDAIRPTCVFSFHNLTKAGLTNQQMSALGCIMHPAVIASLQGQHNSDLH